MLAQRAWKPKGSKCLRNLTFIDIGSRDKRSGSMENAADVSTRFQMGHSRRRLHSRRTSILGGKRIRGGAGAVLLPRLKRESQECPALRLLKLTLVKKIDSEDAVFVTGRHG